MTFIYISIGPITLMTVHIKSKTTDNSSSTMTSNRFHSTGANHIQSSSSTIGHQSQTIQEPSSTSTATSQDEAGLSSGHLGLRLRSLENNAVYVAVYARSLPGSYHCRLFISRSKETQQGLGWTANNDQGGWNENLLSFDAVFNSPQLLLLHRVAQIHEGREALCEQKLRTLRADGTSSETRVVTTPGSSRLVSGATESHEQGPVQGDLDSMARVKQAMRTLLDSNLITASTDRSATLEDDVARLAGQIWNQVVGNQMQALVT